MFFDSAAVSLVNGTVRRVYCLSAFCAFEVDTAVFLLTVVDALEEEDDAGVCVVVLVLFALLCGPVGRAVEEVD